MDLKSLKIYIPLIAILFLIPLIPMPGYVMHTLILVFLWAYLATAWNILGGFAGQLSLGHAAFFGIAAYTSYFMLTWYNISPWIGMFIGGIAAVALSIIIGYPCFRFGIREVYFALATIAFAEIMKDIFIYLRDITGGSLGIWLPHLGTNPLYFQFEEKWPYYYVIVTMWLVSLIIFKGMKRLREYLIAIREDEDVAASIGINITKYKLLALAISSFFTGLGGVFYFQYFRYINPHIAFGLETSLEMALIAIFGGMYSLWGPTIGSMILTPIAEYLRITLGGTYAGSHLIIYGVLLILVIRFLPKGVYGFYERITLRKLTSTVARKGE